jgi:hypothetical protein
VPDLAGCLFGIDGTPAALRLDRWRAHICWPSWRPRPAC